MVRSGDLQGLVQYLCGRNYYYSVVITYNEGEYLHACEIKIHASVSCVCMRAKTCSYVASYTCEHTYIQLKIISACMHIACVIVNDENNISIVAMASYVYSYRIIIAVRGNFWGRNV